MGARSTAHPRMRKNTNKGTLPKWGLVPHKRMPSLALPLALPCRYHRHLRGRHNHYSYSTHHILYNLITIGDFSTQTDSAVPDDGAGLVISLAAPPR